MFNRLLKSYIPNYEDVQNAEVREKYGVFCSVISIICNAIMVVFKLVFGTITGSVAIIADGYNNLSDMGSNMATLFGFKLASKHPDAHHPYGHGRIEYIVGMIISFLVLFVGITSLKEGVIKIFNPQEVTFTMAAVVALIVSILLKFWMGHFNRKIGKRIDSTSLIAASKDSYNDVLLTSATLVSLILSLSSDLPFDGIIGSVVSLLVIKAGVEIFEDTLNPLLGMAPDKKQVAEIIEFVKGFDCVIGVHDIMMHDYGPGRRYMSLHVEVDANEDFMKVHDQVDLIERDILELYNILTTIHMDPINLDDELTRHYYLIVDKIVKTYNEKYSIHDFRLVSGPSHTNLIFDVVLPIGDESSHLEVEEYIKKEIAKVDKNVYIAMQIEHSFI